MKIKRFLSLAIALLMCFAVMVTLFACKDDTPEEGTPSDTVSDTENNDQPSVSEELQLFDGTEYTGKLVYPAAADSFRKEVSNALKSVLGKRPDTVVDSQEEIDADAVEILIGRTNRPESAKMDSNRPSDAWYFVGIIGNKLVINGSNSYMLEVAINYFIETVLASAAKDTAFTLKQSDNKHEILADYCSADWKLPEIPYFKGNNVAYSTAVYTSARLLTEYNKVSSDFVRLLTVTKTNETEIGAYVERLKNYGFTEAVRDTVDKNVYVTMTRADETVYMSYTTGGNSVNVIYDNVSDTVAEISTPAMTPAAGEGAVFYQYGLNQDPYEYPNTGVEGYPNNGMLYIVKCADNSIIIFDGGANSQMIDGDDSKPMEELDAFLHKITGVADGEKITIAAWIITHLHSDHVEGFSKFIVAYAKSYDLKAICANVPYNYALEQVGSTVTNIKTLASYLNIIYPELKEIVVHTGQKLTFADVTVQVMYTHEDIVSALTGTATYGQFNNTSTVFKVYTENMSMMILGDAIDLPEDYMLKAYSKETLKCDIVQVAHHAHDGVDNIYDSIKASIYLVPNSYGGWEYREVTYPGKNWPMYIRGEILEGNILPKYCKNYGEDGEMLFFSGKSSLTVGLGYVDGEIKVVYAPGKLNTAQPVTSVPDSETGFREIDRV